MHDFALFTKILCKIPKVNMLTLHPFQREKGVVRLLVHQK